MNCNAYVNCTCCLQEKSSLSESIANKESQVSTTHVLITFSERTILHPLKHHYMLLVGNTLENYSGISFLCDSVDPYTVKKIYLHVFHFALVVYSLLVHVCTKTVDSIEGAF